MPVIDKELKSAAFFNVNVSPVIAFKSRAVNSLDDGVAEVAGDITLNGITRPVSLKVRLKPHGDFVLKANAGARKFIATTRIQRSDFNMTDWQVGGRRRYRYRKSMPSCARR